jgi:hypothetical protein
MPERGLAMIPARRLPDTHSLACPRPPHLEPLLKHRAQSVMAGFSGCPSIDARSRRMV